MCNCYEFIESKFVDATNDYLISNPTANFREIREKIKGNFNPDQKSCQRFNYSGTIWCDTCGHEKECHPVVTLPCVGCGAKIPTIAGILAQCDDCKEE